MDVKDSNGTVLKAGDSVQVIKDLGFTHHLGLKKLRGLKIWNNDPHF